MKPSSVIFDLDGTLIDNNYYHIEAWKVFYQQHGIPWSDEDYMKKINGRINREIFNYLLQRELPEAEILLYTEEKEALYRDLYAPHIRPVEGLTDLLDALKEAGVPMAVATSGIPRNIDFMFEHLPIRDYFVKVIDSTYITNGKPDPEIFLKAAAFANADPAFSIAFEDSVAGVRSAKRAGMKVVGLTTTHTSEDIHEADLIVKDYTELNLPVLFQLLQA